MVKTHLPMQETKEMQVRTLGPEDPLEEETATHSSILAWEIPRTEEPGGLQSTGWQSRTRLKRLSTIKDHGPRGKIHASKDTEQLIPSGEAENGQSEG